MKKWLLFSILSVFAVSSSTRTAFADIQSSPEGASAECSDGMYSTSTGRGTCSHHGGVARYLDGSESTPSRDSGDYDSSGSSQSYALSDDPDSNDEPSYETPQLRQDDYNEMVAVQRREREHERERLRQEAAAARRSQKMMREAEAKRRSQELNQARLEWRKAQQQAKQQAKQKRAAALKPAALSKPKAASSKSSTRSARPQVQESSDVPITTLGLGGLALAGLGTALWHGKKARR